MLLAWSQSRAQVINAERLDDAVQVRHCDYPVIAEEMTENEQEQWQQWLRRPGA